MALHITDITYKHWHGESVFFEAHGVLWMGVVVREYGDSVLIHVRSPLNVGLGYIDEDRLIKL